MRRGEKNEVLGRESYEQWGFFFLEGRAIQENIFMLLLKRKESLKPSLHDAWVKIAQVWFLLYLLCFHLYHFLFHSSTVFEHLFCFVSVYCWYLISFFFSFLVHLWFSCIYWFLILAWRTCAWNHPWLFMVSCFFFLKYFWHDHGDHMKWGFHMFIWLLLLLLLFICFALP